MHWHMCLSRCLPPRSRACVMSARRSLFPVSSSLSQHEQKQASRQRPAPLSLHNTPQKPQVGKRAPAPCGGRAVVDSNPT